MLRLNRYFIALIIWLSFLFNIERLDLQQPDAFNIASEVYVVTVILVVLGVVLPSWKPFSLWTMQGIGVAGYLVAVVLSEHPLWGGVYTYLSLFELTAVLLSVTLGYMVGRHSAEFMETVQKLVLTDMDGRVYPSGEAESVFKREMQHSRRANRPLSVIVLDIDDEQVRTHADVIAQDIQRLLVKRSSLVALARMVARTLRRTDIILDQTHEGRLVLVMPEMRKDQTDVLINRLHDQVQRRLGVELRSSSATFPEQGVTFEELVHQAELSLRTETGERRTDPLPAIVAETRPVMLSTETLSKPVAEPVKSVGD